MKKIICILIYILLALYGAAQVNELSTDLSMLRRLNATFIHNFVTNDTASHNKILHKDFVCISSNGQLINRKDYLDKWAHGFDGFTYWDYRDESIQLFGNTALVRSKNKYIVKKEGTEVTGMSMYTDTYIKESGEWKCVQAQITRVSPEYFSPDATIVKSYDYRSQR
jgi:hypothetical protein